MTMFEQIWEAIIDIHNIKQNGQLAILHINFTNRLSILRESINKKSGKYLSGFSLINKV